MDGLLNSPEPSGDSTLLAGGKTLPDVSLGSLGSSFRSEDQDLGRRPFRTPVARAPKLSAIVSPETSLSNSIATPSPQQPPTSALLSLSPPPTAARKTSSYGDLNHSDSSSSRRPRVIRRMSMESAGSSDVNGGLDGRFGETEEEDEVEAAGILSALSINVSPGKKRSTGDIKGGGTGGGAGRQRGGRHSTGPGDVSGVGPMTLRDQEQQLNAAKKDIFNLQLENHFLKERLANMAPDHIEAALKENVKLKLEILNLSKDMKKLKKLLLHQDKDLAEAAREREGANGQKSREAEMKELEGMYAREKERRQAAEERLMDQAAGGSGPGNGSVLHEQLEDMQAKIDDQAEEMERLRDIADRAQDELEGVRAGLGDSVGMGKGREARMIARLEEENAQLQAEVEALQRGEGGSGMDELEDRINELRDQLAAAQLEQDRKDQEIDQLNEELDGKVKEHEKEIQEVEAEWRNEVLEARAQGEELREVLQEREEELAATIERVEELQGAQAETHDRLEDTLKNIEQDNADKDGDLIAANREIEELGQRVYELEDAVEQIRVSEDNLKAELQAADEASDTAKGQYENLIAALKEARTKLKEERDGAIADARDADERAMNEREKWRNEGRTEVQDVRKRLLDSEDRGGKLRDELDKAQDSVSRRDREAESLQRTLRSLQDERDRQMVGGRDSVRLQGDIEKVKRDLMATQDELDRAREDLEKAEERLSQRDLERGQMLDKQRDIENRLASERQGRLNISDKLDMANKTARQHERDAYALRERLEELEPMLSETQRDRFQLQRQSEQQRQERSELLLRVFKDVNRFLGNDDHDTPASFPVFRDTLLMRLRSMNSAKSDWEKRIKDTEISVDQKMSGLKRQLEQKWRAIDNFEAAIKKLELTRMQWRSKYSIKAGELEAAKARNAELSQQISGVRADTSGESSSALRSLTERATNAEKRSQTLANQLSQIEARLAEVQAKAGQAEDRWAARVKEYENRLRIAGEKIKTEKQGGKERARQLEDQVRDLEKHVDAARLRNRRAENVVATAAHLLPDQ